MVRVIGDQENTGSKANLVIHFSKERNASMERELNGACSSLRFVGNDPDAETGSRLRRLRYEMQVDIENYRQLVMAFTRSRLKLCDNSNDSW